MPEKQAGTQAAMGLLALGGGTGKGTGIPLPNPPFTLADFNLCIARMKANAIVPRKFETQADVNKANAVNDALGIRRRWRLGDEYFTWSDLSGSRRSS